MTAPERQASLFEFAEQDESYTLWKASYQEYMPQFDAYADAQPEDIRNILRGYGESGRLMYQRVVNLACEHMVFLKEE